MPTTSETSSIINMLGAALALLPVSLILFTYERALNPLYGSGPTNYTLTKVILPTFLASAVNPFRISTTHIWLYAALGLSLAPNATYWVAVWTARRRDPVWGPTITHAAVLAPLIFTWTTCVIEMRAVSVGPTDIFQQLNIVPPVETSPSALSSADGSAMLRGWDPHV